MDLLMCEAILEFADDLRAAGVAAAARTGAPAAAPR